MKSVVETLALLTPFEVDKPKVRVGPPADGGYVMADCLDPDQTVVSYGISTEYRFDMELAKRGHRVFMFDHTIDGIEDAHPGMLWFKEGVAAHSQPCDHLYSIEDHLCRHGIDGGDLLLKMDVEGAELDVIAATSDATLSRFAQIVVEVHGLADIEQPAFRCRMREMLERLNRQFTLFHVHANNYDGGRNPYLVAGLPVVSVLELSYVQTNLVQRRPSQTLYPTIFDCPNGPGEDKKLWFFPFLPTSVEASVFVDEASRLNGQTAISGSDDAGGDTFEAADCVDVAVGKDALQSSTCAHSSSRDEARRAICGTVDPGFAFHTDLEEQPWWQVDLGAVFPVEGVVIHNRGDGCAMRAYRFVVKVADDDGDFHLVYRRNGRPFGNGRNPARVSLEGRSVRHLRIQLEGRDYLHLAAIQVYVRAPDAA